MSKHFSFGFMDEDIEEDIGANIEEESKSSYDLPVSVPSSHPGVVAVEKHELHFLLKQLPSKISYYSTVLSDIDNENVVVIPRRALFDMKLQMMAEAEMRIEPTASGTVESARTRYEDGNQGQKYHEDSNEPMSAGFSPFTSEIQAELGASDIEEDIYEGGLKSWEGASDLARFLLQEQHSTVHTSLPDCGNVIELGCGTALPTLAIFQHAISRSISTAFTLADFNASVLRFSTLPNLLLNWSLLFAHEAFDPAIPALEFVETPKSTQTENRPKNVRLVAGDGDLHVTEDLIERFLQCTSAGASNPVSLMSGSWESPRFLEHIIELTKLAQPTLVLAAETIYSHRSLSLCSDILSRVLSHIPDSRALVAAKVVYFGTGGSVEAFKEALTARGLNTTEVFRNSSHHPPIRQVRSSKHDGLDRIILQIQA